MTNLAPAIDPNTAALVGYSVMVIVLILVITVTFALRKHMTSKRTSDAVEAAAPVSAPIVEEIPQATAPGSAGQLKLHDVEPRTAAMLMAIVAYRMDKPLNELRFISIKEVK